MKKQKDKEKKTGASERKDTTGDDIAEAADKTVTSSAEVSTDASAKTESTGFEVDGVHGDKDETIETGTTDVERDTSLATPKTRQPSSSLQSKLRSSSFRSSSVSQGSQSPATNGVQPTELPPLSPGGDSVNSIYRKQAARLDELEKENRRLAKEAQDHEKNRKHAEEELEELRDGSGKIAEAKSKAAKVDAQNDEISKLKAEVTAQERQISQLQSQTSKRHQSSPSQAHVSLSQSALQTQLDSKQSTIESMEMEISSLRSQLEKSSQSTGSHTEQVSALEAKLDRAERAAGTAQRELLDVRSNLERASEKAVKDGSEKTSSDTKLRALNHELEDSKQSAAEALKRIETLDKKLAALTSVHKDADTRRQASDRQREVIEKESGDMRRRLATLENENLRLREERERARKREVTGVDDDGVDELEEEERHQLEAKIRGMESEIYDLRKGVWHEKRREFGGNGNEGPASPGSKFDDVDLTGGPPKFRRQSVAGQGSSFTTVLASGINAFTGGSLRDPDDEFDGANDDFDESAFRQAQEEEAQRRLERVKEIKRGLKDWEGWRMDVVDVRVGGGGAGEIFDV